MMPARYYGHTATALAIQAPASIQEFSLISCCCDLLIIGYSTDCEV